MSMLKLLQQAQGGQGLEALAGQLGLDRSQADQLAQLLAPAIGTAVKRRAERGDIETVAGQLMGERQAGYFDDPAQAARPEAQAEGAAFLDQILGSSQARDGLAHEAANRSGIDMGTVMQFLPALAAMLQGGMQRSMPDDTLQGMMHGRGTPGPGVRTGGVGGLMGMLGGLLGGARGRAQPQSQNHGQHHGQQHAQQGGLDPLMAMLDADGDGSAMDDILERFLR